MALIKLVGKTFAVRRKSVKTAKVLLFTVFYGINTKGVTLGPTIKANFLDLCFILSPEPSLYVY